MTLPKLLYIGDVPVEATVHGSTLLHRLFVDYPSGHLHVVESGRSSTPASRLKDVPYASHKDWLRPYLPTRAHQAISAAMVAKSLAYARWAEKVTKSTAAEAVITVAHGYGWLSACRAASKVGLPLHLVVHDDWANTIDVPPMLRPWCGRQFGQFYRAAASRLCVSRYMAEEFQRRYGVEGVVLPPIQTAQEAEGPLPRRAHPHRLTAAFAGTINSDGYAAAIRAFATALRRLEGRLIIYAPVERSYALQAGLLADNVELRPILPAPELLRQCRNDADLLFVPMSFHEAERQNMTVGFPSKLADYTAIGLPLMILGPEYCSAVRWASENGGVAEVVTALDEDLLVAALRRLCDGGYRERVAGRGHAVGKIHFENGVVKRILYSALKRHAH